MSLCIFCQKPGEKERTNGPDFQFSFISELLQLSAESQSENIILNGNENESCFNCGQCLSLLEKGHSLLDQIKKIEKELSFVRKNLWSEIYFSISKEKESEGQSQILLRRSMRSRKNSSSIRSIFKKELLLRKEVNEILDFEKIVIKKENETESRKNEFLDLISFEFPDTAQNAEDDESGKMNDNNNEKANIDDKDEDYIPAEMDIDDDDDDFNDSKDEEEDNEISHKKLRLSPKTTAESKLKAKKENPNDKIEKSDENTSWNCFYCKKDFTNQKKEIHFKTIKHRKMVKRSLKLNVKSKLNVKKVEAKVKIDKKVPISEDKDKDGTDSDTDFSVHSGFDIESDEEYKNYKLAKAQKIKKKRNRRPPGSVPLIRRNVPKEELFCKACDIQFKNLCKYKMHLTKGKHISNAKEYTDKTGEIIEIGEAVIEHCPICNKDYPRQFFPAHLATKLHMQNEAHSSQEIINSINKKFPTRYKKPGKRDPSTYKFVCAICDNKRFSTNQKYQRHLKAGCHLLKESELTGKEINTTDLHYCSICDIHFAIIENYKRHMKRNTHRMKEFYRNEGQIRPLFRTRKSHQPESKGQGQGESERKEKVPRRTYTRRTREIHYKDDFGEIIIEKVKEEPQKHVYIRSICDICGKVFHNESNMKSHKKATHYKICREFCKLCPYKTYFKASFKEHMRKVHSVKKNFICSSCGLGFPSQTSLMYHTRNSHSAPTPKNTCPHCSKVYVDKSKLKRHIYSHLPRDHWPYQCKEKDCGKAFVNDQNYDSHVAGHRPELKDSQRCNICNKGYHHKLALYLHKAKFHKIISKKEKIIVEDVEKFI